jgi:hypothetical protein
MMRYLLLLLLFTLSACGGGGSGNNTGSVTPPLTPGDPVLAGNAARLTVGPGPGGNVNIPYVSVTVCVPGTNSCQTIDNILVDTGSTGLRLLASSLNAIKLPGQTSGSNSTILECSQFLDFVTWGPVKLADVGIGSKRASSVPIQVVADPAYTIVPNSCSTLGSVASDTYDLGANGVLGVGLFSYDGQLYYNCAPTSTQNNCKTSLPIARQVQNPVALFATDNNGVVLQLPAIAANGASSVDGLLIFGIDTQTNNQLGNAKVVKTDSQGYFTTVYKGVVMPRSFIDSGSNGLYFDDVNLPDCGGVNAGFYCPASAQSLTATITLAGGATDQVAFQVANSQTLLNSTNPNWAFPNLGGVIAAPTFDWGLPFFFGRSVYTVIEGRSTSAGIGPFFAYTH